MWENESGQPDSEVQWSLSVAVRGGSGCGALGEAATRDIGVSGFSPYYFPSSADSYYVGRPRMAQVLVS